MKRIYKRINGVLTNTETGKTFDEECKNKMDWSNPKAPSIMDSQSRVRKVIGHATSNNPRDWAEVTESDREFSKYMKEASEYYGEEVEIYRPEKMQDNLPQHRMQGGIPNAPKKVKEFYERTYGLDADAPRHFEGDILDDDDNIDPKKYQLDPLLEKMDKEFNEKWAANPEETMKEIDAESEKIAKNPDYVPEVQRIRQAQTPEIPETSIFHKENRKKNIAKNKIKYQK